VPLFEEEFTVNASSETVWDFLLDPQRVAPCLPGCERLEVEDATTYRVRLSVKVGFLTTIQDLRVTITEAERPCRLVSLGRGEDRKLGSHARALSERHSRVRAARLDRRRGHEDQGAATRRRVRRERARRARAPVVKLALTVNGRSCVTETPAHWTVLDLLRDGLGLMGTKYGCGEGVCGTCTVLADGRPMRACLVLAAHARGRALVTVEGLEIDGRLDPLQTAFAEQGAAQCGFCTPGMLLAAKALFAENPAPTPDDVRDALSGNLCRCTGYTKIVAAVLAAAPGRR
jgi:aerobic carbon-monoxide dehydrogenase small subunit